MPPKNRFFDNTRLSSAKRCMREYYLRHYRHWAPDRPPSSALAYGGAWHKIMDAAWNMIWYGHPTDEILAEAMPAWEQHMQEAGIDFQDLIYLNDDIRTYGNAKAMLRNYCGTRRRFIEECELLGVEQPFAVPLDLSGRLFYVGRLDKVISRKNRVLVVEHKTTSSYKRDGCFRSDFLESFSPDAQIDGYGFGAHMTYGDTFKAVYVDAALVHKTVHNCFAFVPVERAFAHIDAWLWASTWWVNRILEEESYIETVNPDGPFLQAFPQDTSHCWHCGFRPICKFYPNPHQLDAPPEGYVISKWEPFDLLQLEKIGLEREDAECLDSRQTPQEDDGYPD